MRTDLSAATATQLSFVAGVAAYDAIAAHLPPNELPRLRLKWPNDVLLSGAKLAGILLESLSTRDMRGLAVILGIGVNVSVPPRVAEGTAASLGLEPAAVSQVFDSLAASMTDWLARWDQGKTFSAIRKAWLARALALNEPISVKLNGSAIRGMFRGIDEAGALQLETEPGVVITVTAGDIYPESRA